MPIEIANERIHTKWVLALILLDLLTHKWLHQSLKTKVFRQAIARTNSQLHQSKNLWLLNTLCHPTLFKKLKANIKLRNSQIEESRRQLTICAVLQSSLNCSNDTVRWIWSALTLRSLNLSRYATMSSFHSSKTIQSLFLPYSTRCISVSSPPFQ